MLLDVRVIRADSVGCVSVKYFLCWGLAALS